MRKVHEAGFTHNDVSARNIVLDGDKLALVGFSKAAKITDKPKELLRQNAWACMNNIDYRANTPKSDLVMVAKFLLRDQVQMEEILNPNLLKDESILIYEFIERIQAM